MGRSKYTSESFGNLEKSITRSCILDGGETSDKSAAIADGGSPFAMAALRLRRLAAICDGGAGRERRRFGVCPFESAASERTPAAPRAAM